MAATRSTAAALKRELDALADPVRAGFMSPYIGVVPGGYGEGDKVIGLTMPQVRAAAREYRELALPQIAKLLASGFHEHRSAAAVILSDRAKRASKRSDLAEQKALYEFYLARTARFNNWDLVDMSCRDVVGEYLLAAGDTRPLKKLARSDLLWDRRIAMVSTWSFIRAGQLDPTFELSAMLLTDSHDLMHKAVGWMLREAGKKDEAALEAFLAEHVKQMPRTALRYSIERLPEARRKHWLAC